MPSLSQFENTQEIIDAWNAPSTKGVSNDPATWLVDWSKPIEWDDGTPAQLYGEVSHGQATVLLDPENLPKGFKASALRRIDARQAQAAKPYWHPAAMICTNVIAAHGTPADGSCRCRVVNVYVREEREKAEAAMEELAMW